MKKNIISFADRVVRLSRPAKSARVATVIMAFLMFSGIMPTSAFAENIAVKIWNVKFIPESVQIKTGDTVTWTNQDNFPHTITGFGVNQTMNPGAIFSHTFNEAGTFDYKCTIHAGMAGEVVVSNSYTESIEDTTSNSEISATLSTEVTPNNVAEVVSNDITDANSDTANTLVDQAAADILKSANNDTQDEIVQSMRSVLDGTAKEIAAVNQEIKSNPASQAKLLNKIKLLNELLVKIRTKVIIKYPNLAGMLKAEVNLPRLYEIRWGNLSGKRAKCTGISLKELRDSLAKGDIPAECEQNVNKVTYHGVISVDRGELNVRKTMLFDKSDTVTDSTGTSIAFNSSVAGRWEGLIVEYTPPKTDTAATTPISITIKIGDLNKTFAGNEVIGQNPIGNNNMIEIRDLAQTVPGLALGLKKNLLQNKLVLQSTISDIRNKLDYIRLLKDTAGAADEIESLLDDAEQYNFDGTTAAKVQSEMDKVNKNIGLDTSSVELNSYAEDLKSKIEGLKAEAKGLKFAEKMIPFKDTDSDQWFTDYVAAVKNAGVISGYKNSAGNDIGEFRPANNVTVAEILKIGLETAGKGKDENRTPALAGAAGHWAKAYVAEAEDIGLDLIKGDVSLDRPATRSEVVRMFLEALGLKPDPVSKTDFSDVPAQANDTGAAAYIEYAKKLGIVSGDSGKTTFRPDDPINRAEVAKIANQILDILLGGRSSVTAAQ